MDGMFHCSAQPVFDDLLSEPLPLGGEQTCSLGCEFIAPEPAPPSPAQSDFALPLAPVSPEPPSSTLANDPVVRNLCHTVEALVSLNKKLEERVKSLEATIETIASQQQSSKPHHRRHMPVVAATRVVDAGFGEVQAFTSSAKTDPVPVQSNCTECRLDVEGLKDEWIADKRLPEMTVRVVDSGSRQPVPVECAFQFSLCDANGVNRNNLLHDKQVLPRVATNGVCRVPGDQLKITKVSSKFGSYFVLSCQVVEPDNAQPVLAFSHRIVIKRQEGKAVKQLRPTHGVDKLPNIGRDTAERMKTFKIATVADLAAFPTNRENPTRFASLLKRVRRERGRMTDAMLEGCIEEARKVVSDGSRPRSSMRAPPTPASSASPASPVSPASPASPASPELAMLEQLSVNKQGVPDGLPPVPELSFAHPDALEFAEKSMKRALSSGLDGASLPDAKRPRLCPLAVDQAALLVEGGRVERRAPGCPASLSEADTDFSDDDNDNLFAN